MGLKNKWPPLGIALGAGKTDVARLLLEHGADPNGQDDGGWSVLLEAVDKNELEIVRLLLEKGADPNHKEPDGWTAVHMAAWSETPDALRLLLETEGCRTDMATDTLDTPLHEAARKGRTKNVELLLEKGADINAKNAEGKTPLARAKEEGHEETAAVLRRHGGAE